MVLRCSFEASQCERIMSEFPFHPKLRCSTPEQGVPKEAYHMRKKQNRNSFSERAHDVEYSVSCPLFALQNTPQGKDRPLFTRKSGEPHFREQFWWFHAPYAVYVQFARA